MGTVVTQPVLCGGKSGRDPRPRGHNVSAKLLTAQTASNALAYYRYRAAARKKTKKEA